MSFAIILPHRTPFKIRIARRGAEPLSAQCMMALWPIYEAGVEQGAGDDVLHLHGLRRVIVVLARAE